ncbi:hypothetical protein BWI97_09475 [Siphonobacter sp. BAB-5405]|uniref:hypothetical protein n=1 Tax=Siphonobacter sp. BAB-5405 TaxID=1864825 RepID=UPI000C7FB8DF|nr:hypothetical protein [Siphonobacter sp. BAB-5405]PMD97124.1 hypothetical protein BWI97_09475 [Siphonobacter sp. BAB-5405]
MKNIIAFVLLLVSVQVFAQDPDVGGTTIIGTVGDGSAPFQNGESISFSIDAGNAGAAPMIWPNPSNLPFEVNITVTHFANPQVIISGESNANYFGTPTITLLDAATQTYTINISQNLTIPASSYTVFTITGTASGTVGSIVGYQANGDPGGYTGTNVGTDNPSSSGTINEVPTPVSLIAFTAKAAGNNAQLDWSTAQEKNNAFFEVQHSTNGQDFESVGTVTGKGTTTARQNYSFVHPGLNPSLTHYYRLKQVDTDGSFALSQVRSVKLDHYVGIQLKASTDPSRNVHVLVNYGDEQLSNLATVHLMDLSGRTLSSKQLELEKGHNRVNFSASSLSSGLYLIRLENISQPAAVKVALP